MKGESLPGYTCTSVVDASRAASIRAGAVASRPPSLRSTPTTSSDPWFSPPQAGRLPIAPRHRATSLADMFERLVVGYAGDRAGRDGVLLASRLAELTGAEVTVVYPYHPLLAEVTADVAEQRVREELGAMLGSDPLPDRARYRWTNSSWPICALHEMAGYEACDLIVFGAAPERIGRRHVDLMERMVHGAPCAVAVAPEGFAEGGAAAIRRVGVGFCDTPDGRAALDAAVALAKEAGGPLRVVAGCGLAGSLVAYTAISVGLPEAEEEVFHASNETLETLAQSFPPQERPTVEVRRGDPGRVLVEASPALDLLVLGSRGYGPVRHALLGSVSAYVMRHARCPVVVLPRDASPSEDEARTRAAIARS